MRRWVVFAAALALGLVALAIPARVPAQAPAPSAAKTKGDGNQPLTVDAEGRLTGVITDGDLRRLHLRSTPIDALSAGEVATRDPKTIREDDLAAKALEVMETWQITSLVIVDGESRPIGLLHMHDILRAKIV